MAKRKTKSKRKKSLAKYFDSIENYCDFLDTLDEKTIFIFVPKIIKKDVKLLMIKKQLMNEKVLQPVGEIKAGANTIKCRINKKELHKFIK